MVTEANAWLIGRLVSTTDAISIVLGLSCILNIPGLIICNSVQYGSRGQCLVDRKVGINYRCHQHCFELSCVLNIPGLIICKKQPKLKNVRLGVEGEKMVIQDSYFHLFLFNRNRCCCLFVSAFFIVVVVICCCCCYLLLLCVVIIVIIIYCCCCYLFLLFIVIIVIIICCCCCYWFLLFIVIIAIIISCCCCC
jgi:hypothetical protein